MAGERDGGVKWATIAIPVDQHKALKDKVRDSKTTMQDFILGVVGLAVKSDESTLVHGLIEYFDPNAKDIDISRSSNILRIRWNSGDEPKRLFYDSETGEIVHN